MAESKEQENQSQKITTDFDKFNAVFAQRNVANNAKHLIPYIKPDSRIIDVGCGIGSITIDLAQRCPQGTVVGIDISEDSIKTAQAAAQHLNIKNVSFHAASVNDLATLFPPSAFDIAHLHQTLLHISNPIPTLRTLRTLTTHLIATVDSAHLTFHPCGPTMTLNFSRFVSTSPGHVFGAGLIHHTWMHEAGFEWEDIRTGVEGIDVYGSGAEALRKKRAGMEGYLGVARQRGEGEEFLGELRREWEAFVGDPGSRVVGGDSWCIGFVKENGQ